jgi:hypothetical protein
MKSRFVTLSAAFALFAVAAACEKSSPVTPSAVVPGPSVTVASVTDASTGVTVGAPQPISPADGAQFKNVEQPVKLAISNGVTTSSAALAYSFEVATDAGFASKVYTKDNVAEGAGGQTSLTLDKLSPAKTYFWRARSGSAGPASKVRSFSIGPEVILQAPVLAAPAQNATVTGRTVTLTANNVGRTGPAERVTYRFEVSDSSSFTNLVFVSSVLEQPGSQTSVTVNTTSNVAATYFWRVQASDPPNAVTTAFSAVGSFRYQPFSLSDATIWDNPPDVANWAETATITRIELTDFIVVDFDKRTGPGRWPESGFGDGGIQYTLGMCLNIDQHWHCSAAIQFWDGRDLEAGGPASEVGRNWYYDARWGALQGHQPSPGEVVGIFVAQGNLRDNGKTSVKERSNVVLVPFGSNYFPSGLARTK